MVSAMAPSEWTIDTLKEHFDELRKDDQGAVRAALNAAELAASKADTAMDKRFDGVNEFRATLSDQAAHFLPRVEYTGQHAAVVDRINILTEQMTKLEAKNEGQRVGTGRTGNMIVQIIVGGAAIVAIVIGISTILTGTRALPVASPVVYQPAPAGVIVPTLPASK